ncbi:hemicentin-1 isoform X2 [Salarias fasciatus]|uniref:hemicentin-1 isoform X2 n=1 Tax=Salarias fasciatus TaxID=181472 RepID=UPI0011764C18|nr:intercellular adhesion molecule 5 isoform X2 [Salarias fasciatus]
MLPLRILGFLWLMFSPCGSESRSCPPDLGPPILRPPEVIKEYGHSLVVNCSSNTEEEYEGLYWRVGNRAFEEDWGSVELDLSLLNYDMNVQCRMKLNESYECSTDLEITVYKNPEVVSSVKHVSDTGEETQYELQCDVFNVAPVQNLTVRVYKNNEAVLIKAFNDSTKTPVNETATLPISVKRTEHVVQLRCEAQLDFGARGEQPPVVVSQTHSVSALHAPEMKRENRTEVKFVLKGDKVTLDCEAEGNPPPVFSWTCDGVDLLGKTNRVTFYPNVTTICICRAANRLGNITKKYVIEINAEASSANPPIITTPAAQRPRGCPLILVPPKIVARFGDPVSAVCNTSATDAEGIGWEVPVQGIGPVPPPSVSWNVEKLVEWEIEPVCYLNLKDGTQCSVTLPVTLYHTPDKVSISGPDHDLIEGNEYRLKCYIHNVAPAEKLKVFWYKDDDELPVREFYEESRTPVTVSDTLIITPTRHYNGSVFKCLAVLDLRPDGPQNLFTVSSPYTAVVQYQPLFVSCPSHFIAVEHESSLDMFPCQMDGNPAPTVQWYHEGEVFNSSEKLTRNDAGQYILEIKNIHGSTNTSVNITVECCPLILVPPKIVARFGDPVSAVCNTSATDAEGIGWEVPVQGIGPVPPPSVTWNVEKLVEWDIEPVCYLNLKDGTQCSVTLPVTLYHTPDKVSISGPDHDLIEGNEYRLKCYIHNVAPAEKLKVFWYKDDDELRVREFSEESRTPVTVSDTLSITPTRHYHESVFKCLALLDLRPDGPQNLFTVSSPYTAVVQYQPLFESCPSHLSVVEHEFSLDLFPCQMDGNPAPTVQWYHEGEVFNSSEKLTRNDAGQYILEIKNIHGSMSTSVNITVEYGPSFTCSERYEVKVNTHIKSLCEPEGEPSPTLTWFKDGKEKVQWTKHDSGEYEIEANNKHGTAKHKVYLDILYAPEFKDGNLSLEVTQGENVTLDCAVEGNPPPEVVWSFSPDVTPGQTAGWRQRTITVTAATSGVYSCNATNEVGNVSRTVSLVFKSKSRGLPFPIWVILVILATLLFIFLLVFFLKRQKSHGQYSFIAANADNISLSTRSTEGRI